MRFVEWILRNSLFFLCFCYSFCRLGTENPDSFVRSFSLSTFCAFPFLNATLQTFGRSNEAYLKIFHEAILPSSIFDMSLKVERQPSVSRSLCQNSAFLISEVKKVSRNTSSSIEHSFLKQYLLTVSLYSIVYFCILCFV